MLELIINGEKKKLTRAERDKKVLEMLEIIIQMKEDGKPQEEIDLYRSEILKLYK